MNVFTTEIPEVKVIVPVRHEDSRGYFSETFRDNWFRENVADVGFVQDNHSSSKDMGTLRGLHFQNPPHAQAKLVRCLSGKIWDVAVDIRPGSSHFGRWVGEELSAENGKQLFIPAGFAHGFVTLSEDTEISYKCSDYYAADCDAGIAWNDPELAIRWPLDGREPILSLKDGKQPRLAELDNPF